MPETLSERQARLAQCTSRAMYLMGRLLEPGTLAHIDPESQKAASDLADLQKQRGKFAGIFTRIAYQADARGIALEPRDLVRGALASQDVSKQAGGDVQDALMELGHYFGRKLPNGTPVGINLGALRSAAAMQQENQKLYHAVNAPADLSPNVVLVNFSGAPGRKPKPEFTPEI